jgi:hypothetical protein
MQGLCCLYKITDAENSQNTFPPSKKTKLDSASDVAQIETVAKVSSIEPGNSACLVLKTDIPNFGSAESCTLDLHIEWLEDVEESTTSSAALSMLSRHNTNQRTCTQYAGHVTLFAMDVCGKYKCSLFDQHKTGEYYSKTSYSAARTLQL